MKDENAIIGEAIITLLSTQPREKFNRKKLEDYLRALYLQKYETSSSLEEIEAHLSALKSVMFRHS